MTLILLCRPSVCRLVCGHNKLGKRNPGLHLSKWVMLQKRVLQKQVLPEKIPYHEGYRLRFCPPSARELLKPELIPPQAPEL